MNSIDKEKHEELVRILQDLVATIQKMRVDVTDYLLYQNEEEAKDWLDFLCAHTDKEELKSLENEISDRFFFRFDVKICEGELDNKRAFLMKDYIIKSNEYLK